ncbi:hypothetical protein SFRURICE_019706 [Spodoptera frugiperda]|nr:hypothetical protein SFRURICE_019706 [Spodoptera frugiperda]
MRAGTVGAVAGQLDAVQFVAGSISRTEQLVVSITVTLRFFFKTLPHTRIFFLCRGCVYNHTSSHAHDTQTGNNILWIRQRVVRCGNRTRYTLRGYQLLSHRINRAVKNISNVPKMVINQLYITK